MKVHELKKFLNKFPDDATVFSAGPGISGYDLSFGEVTATTTIKQMLRSEYDMTPAEFGYGWEKENPRSPCIYHSGQH